MQAFLWTSETGVSWSGALGDQTWIDRLQYQKWLTTFKLKAKYRNPCGLATYISDDVVSQVVCTHKLIQKNKF